MKLTVTLQSYTACASGEGAGLIDSDVVTDHLGYPYLPGRRLKGMLRESALEVTEMLGYGADYVDLLFGNGGFLPGALQISNLRLSGYELICTATELLNDDKHCRPYLHREKLTASFTEVRQQTALDDDGIARSTSLRVTRMLKPGLHFCTEMPDLGNPSCMALLWLAANNLRRMGTGRNRGRGKISCELEPNISSFADACTALQHPAAISAQTVADVAVPGAETIEDTALGRMRVRIRSMGPLVISEPMGDENTVASGSYLPGQSLRGLFAAQIIRALGLNRIYAHTDQTFRDLVLSLPSAGGISYGPSFFSVDDKTFNQSPLLLHATKQNPDTAVNLLAEQPQDAKYIGKQIDLTAIEKSELQYSSPRKALFFHTTRKDNRRAGVSTEQDGAIFFYEALDAGQQFQGWIHGPLHRLQQLRQLSGDQFGGTLGRSRSTQYGAVEVTLGQPEDQPDTDFEPDDGFTLILLSPLVLRNEYGFPELSIQQLGQTLSETLGQEVIVSDSFARTTTIQSFLGVAGVKLPAEMAFAEGSAFQVSLQGNLTDRAGETLQRLAAQTSALGEMTGSGYGRVAVAVLDKEQWKLVKLSRSKQQPAPITIPETLREILQRIVRQEIYSHLAEQGLQDADKYASTTLTNSQIGRLESLLKGAVDAAAFCNYLKSIRSTVRQRMDDCTDKRGTPLLESMEKPCEIPSSLSKKFIAGNLEHLIRRAGLATVSYENDFEAVRTYWRSLLRRMRKLNKMQKGGNR